MKKKISSFVAVTPTAGNNFSTVSLSTITFRSNIIINKIWSWAILQDSSGAYKQINRYIVQINGSGIQQYQIPGASQITNNPRAYFNENYDPCWNVNFLFNVGSSINLSTTIYATLSATDSINISHLIEWDFFNE